MSRTHKYIHCSLVKENDEIEREVYFYFVSLLFFLSHLLYIMYVRTGVCKKSVKLTLTN